MDAHEMAASDQPLAVWQRVLIGRIQCGATLEEARGYGSGAVSIASIEDAKAASPLFARLLTDAIVGLAVLGPDAARENARAYAVPVLDDAFQESRGKGVDGLPVRPRDRVTNRGLLLDAAGVTGQTPLTVVWQPKALSFFQAFTGQDAPPALGDGTGTASKDTQSAPPREEGTGKGVLGEHAHDEAPSK